jgi:tRNA-splicing ligase RtcB
MSLPRREASSGPVKIRDCVWEIPTSYKPGMRVPGIIFADDELMAAAAEDKAFDQVANVAHLPGIERASLAMPDIHWGYGFPIGGVAATRLEDGVISPGGVGFDISCGVRLLRTDMEARDVRDRIREIMHELARNIPKGLGGRGKIRLSPGEIDRVLKSGAAWCVAQGYGWADDLKVIEQGGTYPEAEPSLVSLRAKERGLNQLGTLGSGNHFVEVQEVAEVFDQEAAAALGLSEGRACIMIHSGSRGVGHQVCTDSLKQMGRVVVEAGFVLPDRQLACAPIGSPAGRDYFQAMQAAANFGLANRQAIAHWVRQSFETLFGAAAERLGMDLIYDVSHNIAQFETHEVNGKSTKLCVHRKGATRAFGPEHADVPEPYRRIGQPVMIPGDMGTASYVLLGTETAMRESWGSTCHGAGRLMSRKAAVKRMPGQALRSELEARGIQVEAGHVHTLSEEAPYAYKDIDRVVDVCARVGLSKKVVKLKPIGVLKG